MTSSQPVPTTNRMTVTLVGFNMDYMDPILDHYSSFYEADMELLERLFPLPCVFDRIEGFVYPLGKPWQASSFLYA